MRTIDFNQYKNRFVKLVQGVSALFHRDEVQAEQMALGVLDKLLDRRFVAFRNVLLQPRQPIIPLILVGPAGICVVNWTHEKGVFRASENTWEKMDSRTQAYAPTKINLITQTATMATDVDNFLAIVFPDKSGEIQTGGVKIPEVETALFSLNPGAHIDSTRPAVRLVLSDGVGRFAASILQSEIAMDSEQIRQISEAIMSAIPGWEDITHRKDYFTLKESAKKKTRKPVMSPEMANELATIGQEEPEIIRKVSSKASFNRRQWVMLGILLVVNIIALAVLILLVLRLSVPTGF
jgi:hypothetical protein